MHFESPIAMHVVTKCRYCMPYLYYIIVYGYEYIKGKLPAMACRPTSPPTRPNQRTSLGVNEQSYSLVQSQQNASQWLYRIWKAEEPPSQWMWGHKRHRQHLNGGNLVCSRHRAHVDHFEKSTKTLYNARNFGRHSTLFLWNWWRCHGEVRG